MTERHEAHQKYYMFIFSLLIHLGILVVLLKLTKTDQFLLEKLPFDGHTVEEQKQIPMPNSIAALKSRSSTFGAPIIFHEQPEVQAHSGDVHGNDTIETEGESYEPEIIEEKPQQKVEEIEKSVIEEEQQKVKPATTSTEQMKQHEKTEKISAQLQEKKIIPIKQIRKKTGTKRPGDSIRTATPAKKQLTLADLAEGFINTLNRGGSDWLDRDGDPNKKPDFNDLKYMSYIQKVVWYMQNEWRAAQSKAQINIAHDCILSIVITFAKDGNVQNIRIIQESGNATLDEFLLKGIRRAAPYPPLPHHFNSDTFDLPLNIHNCAKSPQPWQMYLNHS